MQLKICLLNASLDTYLRSMQEESQSERDSSSEHSPIIPQGKKYCTLERLERGKKSQYLAMRNYAVHRDLGSKGIMQAIKRRRSVNKKLNNGNDFQNQEDVLDLLFTRNLRIDVQSIRRKEIDRLNKFYEKSTEKISLVLADGTIIPPQKRQYCKIPKIDFKVSENLPKFERIDMEERFKQQQTVARSFVFRDYGFTALEAELTQNPQAARVEFHKYRNLLGTVLTEAYRRLQSFAIQQCLMEVKPLNRSQLKTLFIALVNCRKYLSTLECDTLLKYVSMCFCLADVIISAEASVKLMSALHEALKRRMQQKGDSKSSTTERGAYTNEKYQMHRIWNGELERLLLDSYHREGDFSKIAKIFKRTYPKKELYFSPEALRIRLNRTLRESIKKLQFLSQEEEDGEKLPSLKKISKYSFKAIIDSPQHYRLRLMLLDVNSVDRPSHNLILSTIKALNQSVRIWDSIRAEHQRNTRHTEQKDIDFDTQIDFLDFKLDEE